MKHKLIFTMILAALIVIAYTIQPVSVASLEASVDMPNPASKQAGEKVTKYDKGYRFDQNGWIYLHIEGRPYERGFQHGYLLAPELAEILRNYKDLSYWDTGKEWEFFVEQGVRVHTL